MRASYQLSAWQNGSRRVWSHHIAMRVWLSTRITACVTLRHHVRRNAHFWQNVHPTYIYISIYYIYIYIIYTVYRNLKYMYIYIYILRLYIHIVLYLKYIYIYIWIYIYIQIYIYTSINIYIYIYRYIYVYIYCIYKYISSFYTFSIIDNMWGELCFFFHEKLSSVWVMGRFIVTNIILETPAEI